MASLGSEDDLRAALSSVLLQDDTAEGIDEDLVEYLAGLLAEAEIGASDLGPLLGVDGSAGPDQDLLEGSPVYELMGPFLESGGCDGRTVGRAVAAVHDLALSGGAGGGSGSGSRAEGGGAASGEATDQARRLRQGVVSISSQLGTETAAEADANRYLWGKDEGVAAFKNEERDAHRDLSSARERRKAKQELERTRREYEDRVRALEEAEEAEIAAGGGAAVSSMILPDYASGRGEKDIQVRNVGLSLGTGRSLLDGAELRFAHGRRYGLVGKNGVGKTTLLRAIASMQIEGFPRHHRVLHVRQEQSKNGGDATVTQAVMEADVERNALLMEESELLGRLEADGDADADADADAAEGSGRGRGEKVTDSVQKKREKLQAKLKGSGLGGGGGGGGSCFASDLRRLDEVYARLSALSADSAESRVATILGGLQFTPEMRSGKVSALSGGWRMRVSLAAALFIEPDLLMLDEPTNHLDLEAVLWLEQYLVKYRHTVIVVSHDRSFLNAVCTDTIEFKDEKLTYYRGHYDTYVRTSEENLRNRMRIYQAYQDKRAHLMEFINKFRANAKRATMVQSRVKTVEKMDLEAPEPVETETAWRFAIPNPEPLGRPVIAIDDVSFDYRGEEEDGTGKKRPLSEYLIRDVNFGVDLESRIGILGPNGAGKSTLLNLIMDQLKPIRGNVSRNGGLRLGYFTQQSSEFQ